MCTDKKNLKDVSIGNNVYLADFINLYGCSIGNNCKIGTFVEIQKDVVIGDNCKISSHSFICEGVRISQGVFIGHNVSFINDRYPMAVNSNGDLKTENDWEKELTYIGENVSIGTSSTIMCGIKIGNNVLIGAGSVVTHDIPENAIAYGNPARVIRYKEIDYNE